MVMPQGIIEWELEAVYDRKRSLVALPVGGLSFSGELWILLRVPFTEVPKLRERLKSEYPSY